MLGEASQFIELETMYTLMENENLEGWRTKHPKIMKEYANAILDDLDNIILGYSSPLQAVISYGLDNLTLLVDVLVTEDMEELSESDCLEEYNVLHKTEHLSEALTYLGNCYTIEQLSNNAIDLIKVVDENYNRLYYAISQRK